MFSAHTERLRIEVEGLVKVVLKHEQIRSLMGAAPPGGSHDTLDSIQRDAPDAVLWKVYDHAASFTRLYALFEHFIFDVVEEWLAMLPGLFPSYGDLPQSVQTSHRVGIGQILTKLGGDQYQHLSEELVLKGLSDGLVSKSKYSLLPDAFYTDGQNLWPGVLSSLLKRVGIDDSWGWITHHRSVAAFLRDVRGDASTPESELKSLVHYRNLAAHGEIGEVVSVEDFAKVAKFVMAISESIAELVMAKVLERRRAIGHTESLGSVIRSFSDNIAGVSASGSKISVHDTIVVSRDHACYFSLVTRIELDHVSYETLTPSVGKAIALELSNGVKIGSHLFRIIAAPNFSAGAVPETPVTNGA